MSESQCSFIFQEALNSGKYAYTDFFVKYVLWKSFYVCKIPPLQTKNQIIIVSVFSSTLQLTALILKIFRRRRLHCYILTQILRGRVLWRLGPDPVKVELLEVVTWWDVANMQNKGFLSRPEGSQPWMHAHIVLYEFMLQTWIFSATVHQINRCGICPWGPQAPVWKWPWMSCPRVPRKWRCCSWRPYYLHPRKLPFAPQKTAGH